MLFLTFGTAAVGASGSMRPPACGCVCAESGSETASESGSEVGVGVGTGDGPEIGAESGAESGSASGVLHEAGMSSLFLAASGSLFRAAFGLDAKGPPPVFSTGATTAALFIGTPPNGPFFFFPPPPPPKGLTADFFVRTASKSASSL